MGLPVLDYSQPDLIAEISFDGDPQPPYRDCVSFDAPLVWYRMNDPSGTTCTDNQAFANGTYNGTPGTNFTLAQAGALSPPAFADESGLGLTIGYDSDKSVLFDGAAGYVSVAHNAAFDVVNSSTNAWTIETWIYPTALRTDTCCIFTHARSTATDIPFVLGYGPNTGLASGSLTTTVGNSTVWVGFFVNGLGWYNLADPTPLTSADFNTWIHYVGTWDGIGLVLYRNGVRVNIGVPAPGAVLSSVNNTADGLDIGRRWDTAGTQNFFPGRIDEVAFYKKDLTAYQVAAHYAAQKSRVTQSWENITSDVLEVTTTRGRTYELDQFSAGTMTVKLDDSARKYDASNSQSPYNGGLVGGGVSGNSANYRILPERQIRVRALLNEMGLASNAASDFEAGTGSWNAQACTIAQDLTQSYAGSASLKTTMSNTGAGGSYSPQVAAKQGDVMRVHARVKGPTGTSFTPVVLEYDNALGFLAQNTGPTVTFDGTWQEVEFEATLGNASTAFARCAPVWFAGASSAVYNTDTVRFGHVFGIFRGSVTAWPTTWEPPDYATTELQATDGFEALAQAQITTSVLAPVAQADAVTQAGKLLDLAYWSKTLRNVAATGTPLTMVPIVGAQGVDYALSLLQDVADSELGSFFMSKDGFATFQDHTYRSNRSAAATFSDDPALLDAGTALEYVDLKPSFDNQRIINEWQVTPDSSISQTPAVALNFDSIRQYKQRTNQRQTRLTSMSDAQVQANLLLSRTAGTGASAVYRYETMDLEPMLSLTCWQQALGREISDCVQVSRKPGGLGPAAGTPAFSLTCFIEQVSWTIQVDQPWRVSWQLSPLAGTSVWQLDATPFDQLDQGYVLSL